MAALTTARFGFYFSFGPLIGFPVYLSSHPFHPPKRNDISPYLGPASATNSRLRAYHRGHASSTCLTVSYPVPHSHSPDSSRPSLYR